MKRAVLHAEKMPRARRIRPRTQVAICPRPCIVIGGSAAASRHCARKGARRTHQRPLLISAIPSRAFTRESRTLRRSGPRREDQAGYKRGEPETSPGCSATVEAFTRPDRAPAHVVDRVVRSALCYVVCG